jgi:hypothetical protein
MNTQAGGSIAGLNDDVVGDLASPGCFRAQTAHQFVAGRAMERSHAALGKQTISIQAEATQENNAKAPRRWR